MRNSIAHSKYFFLGRFIHPNNEIKEDPAAQIQVVSFDEWTDMFHDTLVLSSQLNRILIRSDDFLMYASTEKRFTCGGQNQPATSGRKNRIQDAKASSSVERLVLAG